MTRLGPEYRGKLPPGATAQLRQSLASYRKAARAGVAVAVQILSVDDCPASNAQKGIVYPLDDVPSLPLPGCNRSPCCACGYAPVVR